MSNTNANRRRLLQSLGLTGAAYFLPTLRNTPIARAQTGIPKRLVIFYTHHGVLPWQWATGSTGTTFELGPSLAPLAAHKMDLQLLSGVDQKALDVSRRDGCGHATGESGSLTAQTQVNQAKARGNGPSIDYHVSEGFKRLNGGKSPTLLDSVRSVMADRMHNLSLWGQPYSSPTGNLPVEYNPQTTFTRMFANGVPTGTKTTVDPIPFNKRRSVLDYANGEFKSVANRMGKYESERLIQHSDLIRDLEAKLAGMSVQMTNGGGVTAQCARPNGIAATSGSSGWWDATSKSVPLLMQAAIACDLTRVFCIQCQEPAPSAFGYTPGAVGTTDLHDLVHKLDVGMKEDNDKSRLDIAKVYYRKHAEVFADLIQKLKDIKEADGNSALYHTAFLWAGEIAQPGHSYNNNKWIVAGRAGGYLKTGYLHAWQGDNVVWTADKPAAPSNGDVLATLANAVGVPTTTFGLPSAFKGEVAAMKA